MSSAISPPELNTTELLCYYLALPVIAGSFSEECGYAVAQLDASELGSEEEKSAIEVVCTADCGERLVHFLADECQDIVVASALISLCAESKGIPCHYLTNSYNWTSLELNCALLWEGSAEQCLEDCSWSVSRAVEEMGCCSNYDYTLQLLLTSECGVDVPDLCQYPFKDDGGMKNDEENPVDNHTNQFADSSVLTLRLRSVILFFLVSCTCHFLV